MKTDTTKGIPVDVGKLNAGLRTVFYGVSEVFASIGIDDAVDALARTADLGKKQDNGTSADESMVQQVNTDAGMHKEDTAQDTPHDLAEKEEKTGGHAEHEEAADKKRSSKDEKPSEQTNPKADNKASVSMEDIIKIVTKKIEIDRSCSPRIGSILSSYGVKKLTDLPTNKYEEFLTQLGAL